MDISQLQAVRDVRDRYFNSDQLPASTAVEVEAVGAQGVFVGGGGGGGGSGVILIQFVDGHLREVLPDEV